MNQRRLDLDLIRVAAMVAVVAIHVSATALTEPFSRASWAAAVVVNAAVRWSVPVFVMVTGALHLSSRREETWWKYVRRTVPRLVLPYLAWSVIFLVLNMWADQRRPGLRDVLTMPFSGAASTHLWFMPMLIGVYLAMPLLRRVVGRLGDRWVSIMIAAWLLVFSAAPAIARAAGHAYNLRVGFLPFIGFAVLGWRTMNRPRWRVPIASAAFCVGAAATAVGVWQTNRGVLDGLLRRSPEAALDGTYLSYFAPGTVLMAIAAVQLARAVAPRCSPRTGVAIVRVSALSFGVYFVHPIFIALGGRAQFGNRALDYTLTTPFVSVPLITAVVTALTLVVVHVMIGRRELAWMVSTSPPRPAPFPARPAAAA